MPTSAFDVAAMPMVCAVKAIHADLPAQAFVGVADALGLAVEELAEILGASAPIIRSQCKNLCRLSSSNTEKLVRAARIQQQARRIFSTDGAAAGWLTSSAPALDGVRPIDLLDTDLGAREVESILNGIACGNVL